MPGINLKAEMQVDLAIGQVRLTETFLRFYSPISSSSMLFSPGIFFGGDLQIALATPFGLIASEGTCTMPDVDKILGRKPYFQ